MQPFFISGLSFLCNSHFWDFLAHFQLPNYASKRLKAHAAANAHPLLLQPAPDTNNNPGLGVQPPARNRRPRYRCDLHSQRIRWTSKFTQTVNCITAAFSGAPIYLISLAKAGTKTENDI